MAGLLTLVFGITVALQVMMTDGGPSGVRSKAALNSNDLHHKVKGNWPCDEENKNSVCEDHCFTRQNHKFDCKFIKTQVQHFPNDAHAQQERNMEEDDGVMSERGKKRKGNKKAGTKKQNNSKGNKPAAEVEPQKPAAAANENHQPKAKGMCFCAFH